MALEFVVHECELVTDRTAKRRDYKKGGDVFFVRDRR